MDITNKIDVYLNEALDDFPVNNIDLKPILLKAAKKIVIWMIEHEYDDPYDYAEEVLKRALPKGADKHERFDELVDQCVTKAEDIIDDHGKDNNELESKAKIALTKIHKELRPAQASDYIKWLTGYLKKGGKITNTYDYKFPVVDKNERLHKGFGGWFVATHDFELMPLYGSTAVDVIVSPGVKVKIHNNNLGNNNVYYMDDFTVKGGFVPAFKDVNATGIKQKSNSSTSKIKEWFKKKLG